MVIHVVQFIDENEAVVRAYKVEETDSTSPLVHIASPKANQPHPQEKLQSDQKAFAPTPQVYGNYDQISSGDFADYEGSSPSAAPLESSLAAINDTSDILQQRASTQLERKRREKSPELKYQTFQKSPNFDTFRPRPRSHFFGDAVSMWPLRSMEESRLLLHFIQNIAPWVRL